MVDGLRSAVARAVDRPADVQAMRCDITSLADCKRVVAEMHDDALPRDQRLDVEIFARQDLEVVERAGFAVEKADRFYGKGPKLASSFYLGSATAPA